jgi:hypothetical protein
MGEHCSIATSKHGSEKASLRPDGLVPNGIDAPMDSMESANGSPVHGGASTYPTLPHLAD